MDRQQGALYGDARELDFVGVVAERLRVRYGGIGSSRGRFLIQRLAFERSLGGRRAPWSGRHVAHHHAGGGNAAPIHFQGDGGGGERPIERFLLPHFIGGAAPFARGGGNRDFREDFVGLDRVLAIALRFRDCKKAGGGNFARAAVAMQRELCIERNQRGS